MPFDLSIPLTTFIPFFLAFLVLLIGSYTDIKTREVPDWVNLGLIGVGIGINLIFSLIYWKINFILNSLLGFGVFFAIAWIMFYTGQWGGGDSKILMGLGAVIGIDIFSKNFFMIDFLVNSFIIGAVYGILWALISIIFNKKKFINSFKKILAKRKVKKVKRLVIILSLILLLSNFTVDNIYYRMILLYSSLIIILTLYLWLSIKAVEDAIMMKYVYPNKLTEGDWIAKEIKVDGKYITGPKELGISRKQISKLKSYYKKKKVKKILIKEGIPFVPSFLISFIITIMFGNLVFMVI